MINTFEFIEVKKYCRLASNENDLLKNKGTYLPLFNNEFILLDQKKYATQSQKDQFDIFFETHSNGGFNLNQLFSPTKISGSTLAHLEKVVIKDSSLLVLVSENLSLIEGYGDRRWADYQINTWPSAHNFPLCAVGIEQNYPHQMRVKTYQIDKKIQHIPIPAIYLSVRSQDNNVYHWLIETLVRLKCLENVPNLKELPLIVRDPLNKFQLESLEMMGVNNKLIITNGASFSIDDLYFPSIPSPPSLHRESMEWLRKKFLDRLPELPKIKGRRLYISRSDSTRQVINENQIFSFLKKEGFEKLVMSQLTLAEQIEAFRAAEIIVLPHGAAGSLLLFSPPDCKVLELHSPKWINNCYLSLCNSLDLNYEWLIGSELNSSFDYSVSLENLKNKIFES